MFVIFRWFIIFIPIYILFAFHISIETNPYSSVTIGTTVFPQGFSALALVPNHSVDHAMSERRGIHVDRLS